MTVRNALLGLLAQRPRHGYELHAAFLALAGGEEIWDVKPAQVYTTLGRLEDAGFVSEIGVEKDHGPEKRIYALTPEGKAELDEWFATGAVPEHQRDESFVKLMLALSLRGTDPYGVIRVQRAALFRSLHDVTERRQRADPRLELGTILLLDKAAMQLEAELRWLEMVEGRLEDVRSQPPPRPQPRRRGRPRRREANRPASRDERAEPARSTEGRRA